MANLDTETVRLDHALERLAESDRTPASRAQLERFEAVLRSRQRASQRNVAGEPPTLVDEVFDFIMPQLHDPAILQGSRYLGVLEDLIDDLESGPQERDEITHWASLIVRHEARKHKLLWQYLNGLIES